MDPLSRPHRSSAAAGSPLAAHRLARWQRLALYASGWLLLASGTLWLAVHYAIGAGASELPHPLEPWLMRLHGLAAFASLVVLGALSAAHVPQGWRVSHRRHWASQRRSGVLLCACASLLALTGYALYFFAPEGVRPAIGWSHSGVGVAMALLVTLHRRGGHVMSD